MTIKYRPHRGGLAEAMTLYREFTSISYNDFDLANRWPYSIVANTWAYDDNPDDHCATHEDDLADYIQKRINEMPVIDELRRDGWCVKISTRWKKKLFHKAKLISIKIEKEEIK